MLGKPIKYDLKSSAKIFILLHGIFLLICVAGRIFVMDRLDFTAPANTLIAPITIIFTLGIFLSTAITLCTSPLITFRFYQNLFSREGYLSSTIPASGIEHLWAKIISGYLLAAVDIMVISAGILILLTSRNVVETYGLIAPEITEALGMPLSSFGFYIFVFCVVGSVSSVLMIYFSIRVGQLFPGHRVLGAIAVYFITSFVIQIVVFVIMAVFGLFDFYGSDIGTFADNTLLLLIPTTVFTLVLTVVQYIAVHFIIKKKNQSGLINKKYCSIIYIRWFSSTFIKYHRSKNRSLCIMLLFLQRLNGVEPSHMPPEGIALSTELQTHSGLFKQISDFLEQP